MADLLQLAKELLKVTTDPEKIEYLKNYIKWLESFKEQTCMVCGKTYMGEDPKMCCSGRDCGCLGLPIEPMVCSEECYNKILNNSK
jgi:hypothetical protein